MSDNKPTDDVDVTKEWRATHGQKSAATRLRIFAAIAWIIAIGTEVAGVVMLRQHKFDHGNLPLLIGLLVVIAIFAIAGNLMWKAANKHDPARESDPARFFFQNQLGAIITVHRLPAAHCPDLHGQGHGPEEQEDRGRHRRRPGGGRDVHRDRLQSAVGRAIYPGHEQVRGRDQSQPADHRLLTRGGRPGEGDRSGFQRRWRTRRRAPPIRTASTSSTGSLRRTAPRSRRRRMSSTSARASARCAARP